MDLIKQAIMDWLREILTSGIIMAIPRELPRETWADLVRDYCREQFVMKGMCVDFAIHDKGDGNPHAHVMMTMQGLDENGRWLPKAHKVCDLDENGKRIVLPSGEYKSHKENVADWNDRMYAELWRQAWADAANRCLESSGFRSGSTSAPTPDREKTSCRPSTSAPPSRTWRPRSSAPASEISTGRSPRSTRSSTR